MKARWVVARVLIVVVAIPLAVIVAGRTEGIAYGLGWYYATPGMIIAGIFVQSEGLAGVARPWLVELVVDSLLWFLFLSWAGMFVLRRCQRRHISPEAEGSEGSRLAEGDHGKL